MINLRLAEYDLETGRFVRFLELGTHFGYFGDYINLSYFETTEGSEFKDKDGAGFYIKNIDDCYDLDQKDPLNRFDGLFDGRTYGGGKFVLMNGFYNKHNIMISGCVWQKTIWEDDIFYCTERDMHDILKLFPVVENYYGVHVDTFNLELIGYQFCTGIGAIDKNVKRISNIHEAPELAPKIDFKRINESCMEHSCSEGEYESMDIDII